MFGTNLLTIILRFISIVLAFIALLFILTVPGWNKEKDEGGEEIEVKPFPSTSLMYTIQFLTSLASLAALVSVLWQHSSVSAVKIMSQFWTYGTIQGHIGLIALVLGWVPVLILFLVSFGSFTAIVLINTLVALTENEN